MRYRHGVATNRGLVRSTNEDSFLVRSGLYVVCDGMGGASAGEIASQIACQSLLALDPRTASEDDLRKAVGEANEAIVERSSEEDTLMGMGTTLTAALAGDDVLTLAHVGDSRAYLLRGGEFRQMTDDHSWVGELVRRGELTPAQAAVHPHRSVITRALGTESDIEPDMVKVEVHPGDRLVLCTDGLSGMVPDARVASILAGSIDPQAIADALVQEALAEGGEDNITVVVILVDAEAEEAIAAPAEDGGEGSVQMGPAERSMGRGKGREKARAPIGRVRQRLGGIQGSKRPTSAGERVMVDGEPGEPGHGVADVVGDEEQLQTVVPLEEAAAFAAPPEGAVPEDAAPDAATPIAAAPAAPAIAPAPATAPGASAAKAPARVAVPRTTAQTAPQAAPPDVNVKPAKRRRRRGLLVALIVVLVLALGVAGFGVFNYSVYYVGNYNGTVALFHGMPGEVLGISLSRAIEVGPATYGGLEAQVRAKVDAHSLTSKEEGQKFLHSLTSLP
jgi:serine/threonine protein phosphatase PrpC